MTFIIMAIASAAIAAKIEITTPEITLVKSDQFSMPSKILIKFSLPDILNNARIDLAKVILDLPIDTLLDQSFSVAIFPYHEQWNSSLIPIILDNLNYSDSIAYVSHIKPCCGDDEFESGIQFDITSMIQDWKNGLYANNGLIIMPAFNTDTPLPILGIASGNVYPRARVIIYYTGPEKEMGNR